MGMRSHVPAMLAAASLAALVSSEGAAAQEAASDSGGQLEEIVVTAQRRAESLQDVPISVTNIGGAQLSRSGIEMVQSLPRLTPGLEINRYAQFVSLFLRGVGTRYANLGLEPTVGLYFDDLYSARSTAAIMDFVDIDHVEVLKGPQGTLYGRNTAGGTIRVITKDPVDHFEGKAAFTYGRFDRTRLDGMINIPLAETLSSRFAVTWDRDNGFVKSAVPGMDRSEDKNSIMATGKLLWQPNDNVDVKLAGSIARKHDRAGLSFINLFDDVRQTGVALGGTPSPGFYTSTNNYPMHDRDAQLTKVRTIELRTDIDVDFATLSSITGYRYFFNTGGADLDATDISFQNGLTAFENGKVFSQEFQAVSNGDGPVSWIAGLYYYRERSKNTFLIFGTSRGLQDSDYQDPAGLNQIWSTGKVDIESLAPYVQGTYAFTDQLSLTLGGRYSWERKKMPYHVAELRIVGANPITLAQEFDQKLTFKKFTPKVNLEFRPMKRVLIYGGWSRGFKSGGFNLPAPGSVADQLQPEVLDAYEIGWKTEFGNVRFNGAGFYYDYKDIQIGRSDPVRGSSVVQNAASAEIYGIEGDLTVAVSRGLELGTSATYVKSKFKKFLGDIIVPRYTSAACTAAGNIPSSPACRGFASVSGVNLSGYPLPLAPKFSGNIRGSYTAKLGDDVGSLLFNTVLSYTGKFNWGAGPTFLSEPSKTLLSAQVTYTLPGDRYSVTVFGDNLLGEKYRTNVTANANGGYYTPGAPMTWGIRVAAEF